MSKDGDWSETYLCNLVDWHLKEQETMPWLSGTAYWPFKDFSTPVRPDNPIPYMNQKGVVERDFTQERGLLRVSIVLDHRADGPHLRPLLARALGRGG